MKKMFLDIETLPASQDKHRILKEIFEYKNTKKEQKKTVRGILPDQDHLRGGL